MLTYIYINIFAYASVQVSGKDDVTGEALIKRGDDTEDKLKSRLNEFHSKTTPVLNYYADKVSYINADNKMHHITNDIRKAL